VNVQGGVPSSKWRGCEEFNIDKEHPRLRHFRARVHLKLKDSNRRNNQNIIQISAYSEMFSLIWKELDVRSGQKALDIGVGIKGFSAKQMLDQKLKVVGIDIDPNCQTLSDELGFPIHICDASLLPFEEDSFDFSLAFFSMHEIDPKKHFDVFSEMKRVSKKVAIIEPLPSTDELSRIYDRIWQEAMESVGKFEIHQPIDYWINLMLALSPKKIAKFQLRFIKKVTKVNVENFCNQSKEHFKRIGVNNRHILEIMDLAEKIAVYGMEQSDAVVIVGSFN
jgi:ubiquinone/menaquinone biosynthesis C-methylase UbiE